MDFAVVGLALVLAFLIIVVRDLETVDLKLKFWILDFRFKGQSKKKLRAPSP
jgi:hypothetical protein